MLRCCLLFGLMVVWRAVDATDVDATVTDLDGLRMAVEKAASSASGSVSTIEILAAEIDFQAGDEVVIPSSARLSLFSTSNAVLYGGGVSRFFSVHGELSLEGLSLVNGLADNGGAVWVAANGTLKATRCTFAYNRAARRVASGKRVTSVWGEGGAVYCGGTLHAHDCRFEANAGQGGALWLGEASLPTSQATGAILHSTFSANKSPAGAGAVANYGELTIVRTLFKENSATTAAGAVLSAESSGHVARTSLVIHGSRFQHNTAGFGGSEDITIQGGSFAGDASCAACEASRAEIGLKSGFCAELVRGDECTGCLRDAFQCALAEGAGLTKHMPALWW